MASSQPDSARTIEIKKCAGVLLRAALYLWARQYSESGNDSLRDIIKAVSVRYEWDEIKAKRNVEKHGVSFEEAATVFTDTLSLTIADLLHSFEEKRFVIIGEAATGDLLVVVHTHRQDTIRIISAREATRREKRNYEDKR